MIVKNQASAISSPLGGGGEGLDLGGFYFIQKTTYAVLRNASCTSQMNLP